MGTYATSHGNSKNATMASPLKELTNKLVAFLHRFPNWGFKSYFLVR